MDQSLASRNDQTTLPGPNHGHSIPNDGNSISTESHGIESQGESPRAESSNTAATIDVAIISCTGRSHISPRFGWSSCFNIRAEEEGRVRSLTNHNGSSSGGDSRDACVGHVEPNANINESNLIVSRHRRGGSLGGERGRRGRRER